MEKEHEGVSEHLLREMRTTGDSHQKIEIADVFIFKKYIPLKASLMEFMKNLDMINKNTEIDVLFEDGHAGRGHELIG